MFQSYSHLKGYRWPERKPVVYRSHKIAFGLLALVLFGFGCWNKQASNTGGMTQALDITLIDRINPADAARVIKFKEGSSFEIHQRAVLLGDAITESDTAGSKRVVTLNAFSSKADAVFRWDLREEIPAPSSTQPTVQIAAGSLKAIELNQTHDVMLPVSWPEGEGSAYLKGGVWASDTCYQELSRTRVSTVYLHVLDPISGLVKDPTIRASMNDLTQRYGEASARTDLDLMRAQGDLAEYPLQVNGKQVNVQVIKARNWYGEITVLNNPDNPLILAFTFDPPTSGSAVEASRGMDLLKSLMSYEITRIDI
jgi:hypothetical protein